MLSNQDIIQLCRSAVPDWVPRSAGITTTKNDSSEDQFECLKIEAGLTNKLTIVRLCKTKEELEEEEETSNFKPKRKRTVSTSSTGSKSGSLSGSVPATSRTRSALFREYGASIDRLVSRSQEEAIAVYLSETGVSVPKIYLSLPGGRIEQFIENARSLKCSELREHLILGQIAGNLAKLHSVPLPKTIDHENQLLKRLKLWLSEAEQVSFDQNNPEERSKYLKLQALDLKLISDEVNWFVTRATKILPDPQPDCLCHFDLQEGNILLTEFGNLLMIDFEYSGCGPRGFDFGNLFCEMSIDYNIKAYPGFAVNPDHYPDEQTQDVFLRAYLLAQKHPMIEDREEMERILYYMRIEAEIYTLASHLIWTLWSIMQSRYSTIPFGYLEYATYRIDQYHSRKKILLSKIPEIESIFSSSSSSSSSS